MDVKSSEEPEIILVVDKLLTGFDAPRNTVLYLARALKEHTLLQAIARVNRLFDGKEYGLILDYSGVIQELDEAIDFYQQLADYDREDLAQTVTYIEDQTARLPQQHSDVWELFAPVKGTQDPDAYEELLRNPELRNRFYERFGLFARTLALALSSTTFLTNTSTSAPAKSSNFAIQSTSLTRLNVRKCWKTRGKAAVPRPTRSPLPPCA